jgi:hypothetical protein
MQIFKDVVMINISPSQRRVFRDPKYTAYFKGISLDAHGSSRPRIPATEIEAFVAMMRRLKLVIVNDPEYQEQMPAGTIDQIILKAKEAAAAHRRLHPAPNSGASQDATG